ncbi:hypothetical protein DB41_GT00030, partial [Neochlamydia sp. TUME1]
MDGKRLKGVSDNSPYAQMSRKNYYKSIFFSLKRGKKMKLDLLDIYTDYLISQNQQAKATGLSNLLDGQV